MLSTPAQDRAGADSLLLEYLRGKGLAEYAYDDVELFTCGRDKFTRLIADIDSASDYVHLEYFIIANDSVGTAVMTALERAARRGVTVRVVTDDYKSRSRNYGYTPQRIDSLRRVGVDIRMFDPWRFPFVNHIARDHRKVVVIDGRIGYIGGLNVADYYVDGKPEEYGGWRDTHIRLRGKAVEGLQLLFRDSFVRSGGERFEIGPIAGSSEHESKAGPGKGQERVVYFERSRESHAKKAETRRALVAAFDAARDTLLVVSPYFLPTRSVRRALLRAADRGVHVEVLFSKVGDTPMLSVGNYDLSKRLVRHGIEVYLYRGAFHHSKILMADGCYSMVGSANLNSRSLRWDYEASCFVFSSDLNARLTAVFNADKLECDTFSIAAYRREKPFRSRLFGWFVNHFLTPIL